MKPIQFLLSQPLFRKEWQHRIAHQKWKKSVYFETAIPVITNGLGPLLSSNTSKSMGRLLSIHFPIKCFNLILIYVCNTELFVFAECFMLHVYNPSDSYYSKVIVFIRSWTARQILRSVLAVSCTCISRSFPQRMAK